MSGRISTLVDFTADIYKYYQAMMFSKIKTHFFAKIFEVFEPIYYDAEMTNNKLWRA